jgi:predicted esterase
MDPRGRARIPADLFIPVAERFGYVLVSSYNTASDGPIDPNLKALQAMWNDVHRWLAIDDRRVYMAGFSGTARTACLVARQLAGRFAGVIGTGAGYAPDYPPTQDQSFLYYGAVGDLDFNFFEMQQLEDTLVDQRLSHRVTVFSGGHAWMPVEVATAAVEWLELRAMQAGRRERDGALLSAWWQRDEAAARSLVSNGRELDGARLLAAMARDYDGLREIDDVARQARELAGSSGAKRQSRERDAEFRRTTRYMEDAMRTLAEAFPPGSGQASRPVSAVSAELGLVRLRDQAADTTTENGRSARRLLANISTQVSFYLPQQAAANREYARAAFYTTLAADINPQAPHVWYQLAMFQARAGQRRAAIEALGRAVDLGFRDRTRAESEAAFGTLRGDEDFAQVLNRMGGSR